MRRNIASIGVGIIALRLFDLWLVSRRGTLFKEIWKGKCESHHWHLWFTVALFIILDIIPGACQDQPAVRLPQGVKAVWEIAKAYREATPTRERICINGLWQWQPADPKSDQVPTGNWGYFKVPGCWPGITDYMQKDFQTVHVHPSWKDKKLGEVTAAWYQREISIPSEWIGRRFAVYMEYLNSYAAVYIDGKKVGDIRFPAGEVDLTSVCQPGGKYVLSLLVVAMPLKGVMLSFSDTNAAREVKGAVARRGLCGDLYLVSTPKGARLGDVKVDTSVRKWEITFEAGLLDLAADAQYTLRAQVAENSREVREFTSKAFTAADLKDGRFAFTEKWKPDKLWDIHTPQNQYDLSLSLLDAHGKELDMAHPVRFGFREFWIDGRDFYLNGTRIFLCAVPLDNAQVGAALASYEGALESLKRLQSFGINFVYTHNYDCEPGAHLSFAEILRAADDVGMLVALSQPHFSAYDWRSPDAEQKNGYARHAEFYVRIAQNHPSVVMYSTSHNATGYAEDMNPDTIDGITRPADAWSNNNAIIAMRAEAIIKGLDPSRIVYHHSSGNLSSMYTVNFYPNWVPIQEMCDWFEHWATKGVKPLFLCEYGAPFTWDWAMYRGWYKGSREFGSAVVPWDFCLAEWNAQFLGDMAYRISEPEKRNLRWEAEQFREGRLWHRWDYPHQLGSSDFDERYPILAAYLTDTWRAFRTWGVSAISPWEHHVFWKLRSDVKRNQRLDLTTDWENLQRPGFSPDYLEERYERMDLSYQRTDWLATLAAEAMYRNNRPLLAYIAGKPTRFTSKDHNFFPGEVVEKQVIIINNSREMVTCECSWSFNRGVEITLAEPRATRQVTQQKLRPPITSGTAKVTVKTGEQQRIHLRFKLRADLEPGAYELTATVRFSTGETQADSFVIHVMPRPRPLGRTVAKIALFDPKGETNQLLSAMGVRCQLVEAKANLSGYDVLIIGKAALTVDGPAPDIKGVRNGLKVLVFEQTSEALEKRLGFRVAEYGLRNVFRRVPDHPVLAGLYDQHLRYWRGEATLLPSRLDYELSDKYSGAPVVRWCGLEVPRLWRCGNWGNVASVLIEKPARGDFLPIIDGGFSLQYSPLLEYREGKGAILFCQMDVTGRTEDDPAAIRLVQNMLSYLLDRSAWKPAPCREALYIGDPAGKFHLERAGISTRQYEGGDLSVEQVLIVGRGGGEVLKKNASAVARWLKAGGHLLAIELDAEEANMFLPAPIKTTKQEHIAAYFEPLGVSSLFAGVSPADVHNRDPRELPLVSGGAKVIDNGVLAQTGNIVFCQLAPYRFVKAPEDAPAFAVTAEEAVEGKQSALLTMGTVPWGQFGQKVQAGEVGKTYTFTVFVKALGKPVRVRLEVERAGRPWDRAVRSEDTEVPADKWTELHVTFKVEKPYPEGWQAYLHCGQPYARLRADLFRLYEGTYVPGQVDSGIASTTQGGKNFFANPSFETGMQPWFFSWQTEQHNLRKTYRRTSFLLTRLLANMGVRGETPLLSRFSTPVRSSSRESVVKNGDFRLDSDNNGMPDYWEFSTDNKQATCILEEMAPGAPQRCLRITCPEFGERGGGSAMIAQHDVPAEEGQWYRISLKAKSEGFKGASVALALQNTDTWQSLFGYKRFAPTEQWKEFTFLVQANATTSKTRFQIWHSNVGTLWLSDIRMMPCEPPSQGRWTSGLYLDAVQEWDDPYRFFRW